jgi:hypothetical protein
LRVRQFTLPRFFRLPALALAVASLVVTALATAGGVASAQQATAAGAKAKAAPAAARTIRFRVVNATGAILTVSEAKVQDGRWREGQQPPVGRKLYQLETDDYNIESTSATGDARGYVIYRIGSTDHYVKVYGFVPSILPNGGWCQITNQSGSPKSGSGYQCEYKRGSGNDMNMEAVVEPDRAATHTLTDSTTPSRRDAVDGLCSSRPGLPANVSCTANTLDNIEPKLGTATPASSTLVNCGSLPNPINTTATYTAGTTNTIGITVEAQVKLSDAWQGKVALMYQRSWTESRSVSESVTLNVPAGRYGYIAARPGEIAITGDYTLKAGNQTYQIGAFTVTQPATAAWLAKYPQWRDTVAPQDFEMNRDEVCGSRTNPFETPRPADISAGGTYNVAVTGSNQWALTVPDRSHDAGTRVVLDNLANGSGRNQQWALVPIPGQPAGDWQLASGNTPQLCLEAGTDTTATIFQANCSSPTNYDLGRQVWRLAFDPALGGYELIQPYTQKRLALTEERLSPGQSVWAVRYPIINRSRWTFSRLY